MSTSQEQLFTTFSNNLNLDTNTRNQALLLYTEFFTKRLTQPSKYARLTQG